MAADKTTAAIFHTTFVCISLGKAYLCKSFSQIYNIKLS